MATDSKQGKNPADTKCPVMHCKASKADWHLTCAHHWGKVPAKDQKHLMTLFANERGSEAHRTKAFDILKTLNAKAHP